jgi:hypothetical protein
MLALIDARRFHAARTLCSATLVSLEYDSTGDSQAVERGRPRNEGCQCQDERAGSETQRRT